MEEKQENSRECRINREVSNMSKYRQLKDLCRLLPLAMVLEVWYSRVQVEEGTKKLEDDLN